MTVKEFGAVESLEYSLVDPKDLLVAASTRVPALSASTS
jgi:hypothetical protein